MPPVIDDTALREAVGSAVRARQAALAGELLSTHNNLNKRLRGEAQAVFSAEDAARVAIGALMADGKLRDSVRGEGVDAALAKFAKSIDKAVTDASLKPVMDATDAVRPDAETCRKRLADCHESWKEVKTRYINDPPAMWEMFQFRKHWVNTTLATLNSRVAGGKLVAKSVGSTNLTSDYDVTLSTTDGSGAELEVIKVFNAACKATFRVPPGFCFDTNLYAKDFLKVEDNLLAPRPGPVVSDEGGMAEVETFLEENQSDQDVGALTKQRQYMGLADWVEYKDSVLEAMPDRAQRNAAMLQFEEAETLYVHKVKTKTDALVGSLETLLKTWDGETPTTDDARREHDANKAKLQSLLTDWRVVTTDLEKSAYLDQVADAITDFAHEHAEADMLETNNAIYLDKMGQVRAMQKEHKLLDAAADAVGTPTMQAAFAKLSGTERAAIAKHLATDETADGLKAYLKGRVDGLKARAKKDVAEANFFASEAYLSEGPLQHIVAAIQSGSPEVLERMKPEHVLGSVNEQFGDYMKDIGHYADPGEAFCQTSKYVERLLDGVQLLRGKDRFQPVALTVLPATELERWKTAIQRDLLPIRGGKGRYADMGDVDRFAEALRLAGAVHGVTTTGALTDKLKTLVKQVNADVRSVIALRPDAAAIGAYAQQSGAAQAG